MDFIDFLRGCYPSLAAWARTRAHDGDVEPEDLLGATIERLHGLRDRLTGDADADRAFAFEVSKNVLLELRRRRRRDRQEQRIASPHTSRPGLDGVQADWRFGELIYLTGGGELRVLRNNGEWRDLKLRIGKSPPRDTTLIDIAATKGGKIFAACAGDIDLLEIDSDLSTVLEYRNLSLKPEAIEAWGEGVLIYAEPTGVDPHLRI